MDRRYVKKHTAAKASSSMMKRCLELPDKSSIKTMVGIRGRVELLETTYRLMVSRLIMCGQKTKHLHNMKTKTNRKTERQKDKDKDLEKGRE